ncbi:MAG: 4-carboxymuconolactone decarboxylase [Hyphomicrobiaceae bacterium TMED74]|nr:4-carboxymuconolactone decarboxylase [Filomicrobium sp.]RPG35812.1 MAG: 4-carboxymuconolactone decarboxylase [Hyphomicrobiaceae bacterium TMED74]
MSDDKTSSDLRAQGDKIRREVLGDARVDSTTRDPDAFNAPLIDYLTKYAWGDVWSRPGLDKRSRSILNLGMLSALGRADELRLHIRGALCNGVTKEEIQEIFLQVAVYCGAPAALEVFKVAEEVFEEDGV